MTLLRRRQLLAKSDFLDPTLEAYWPLNSTLQATDLTGNHNGTLINSPLLVPDRKSITDEAYRTNGSTPSYINVGKINFNTANFSFSFWAFCQSSIERACLGNEDTISVPGIRMFMGDQVRLDLFDSAGNGNFGTFPPTLTVNTWHHIVFNVFRDDPSKRVDGYFNGTFGGALSLSASTNTSPIISSKDFIIGNQPDLSQTALVRWDDFRIYNRILTTQEITDLYNE